MGKILRRYDSTIYGNYRRAYLRYGVWVGLAMSAYVLLRWALGLPLRASVDYGLEIVLSVGIFFYTYRYRKSLTEQRVTFKELMLLGLGTGAVAGLVLCVFMCLYCDVLNPQSMADFTQSMMEANPDTELMVQNQSTAPYWGISMGLHAMILSILIAFLASLLFRTEENKLRSKK